MAGSCGVRGRGLHRRRDVVLHHPFVVLEPQSNLAMRPGRVEYVQKRRSMLKDLGPIRSTCQLVPDELGAEELRLALGDLPVKVSRQPLAPDHRGE
jgi:hypothetical protein